MNVYSATRFLRKLKATAIACCLFAAPAAAHEYWLEPGDYTPEPGAKVVINHNYGQHFKGDGLPFVSDWHKRYVAIDSEGEHPITGYDGDLPAVTTHFSEPGLTILAFDGTPEFHTFPEWEKFESFLKTAGLENIGALHRAEGKHLVDIVEHFARKAKLLVAVGNAKGKDRAVGLPLELIAGRNPYMLKPGATLPVQLLYKGKPIAGVTVLAFKGHGDENPARVITDSQGHADIALPVSGPYLLSAIHMFEPQPADKADWSSLWTSLTFKVK